MSKIPCLYSIVRFAPLVETGEFANVGVIVIAPTQRFFGFKLMTQRYSRVTQFFDPLDGKVYRATMRILREELDRVDTLLRQNGFDKRLKKSGEDFARHLFTEIVRPREAVLKFSEPHPILAADPKAAVAELYGHYVERTFVTREYQEAVLEKGIRRLLYQARISERFSRVEVGNDEYHATFPFVEKQDERAVKVIKPLHLDHAQPSRILDHGGQWLFRIQTLKKRGLLPSRVLFAIRSPESQDSRSAAAREIAESLIDNGVEVLAYGESQRILEFAAAK